MKPKTFMLMAAAALLAAACGEKDQPSFSSFDLTIATHDGAKVEWADGALWWESNRDAVLINGVTHTVVGSGTSWHTEGTAVSADDGRFYVAYPAGTYNSASHTASWDGTSVPLACKGQTNKLTLYPCCAVVRSSSYTTLDLYTAGGDSGCESGMVVGSGTIDISTATLSGSDEITTIEAMTAGDGYNYFVVSMVGSSVSAVLDFDWGSATTNLVTLQNGYLYTID